MSRGPRKSKEVREAEARDRERYAMKRSEAEPRHLIFCSICGDLKNWAQFMPGSPPVCCDCDSQRKHGRATPAEPRTTALGATPQLALFES